MESAATVLEAARPTPVDVARALTVTPSAPAVVARLSLLLHGGNPTLAEIGRIVRHDPGLAAHVLRAGYQRRAERMIPCFTIEDAVNTLGFAQLHRFVSEVSRLQVFEPVMETYGLHMEEFWRSSVACALAAELLAEKTGEDPDSAYILGLMHNIGMLAVEAWSRNESSFLLFAHRGWQREYGASEAALLGFTHAEAGAALLSSWDFPRATVEAVRSQYVPARYGPYARLTCLLHAAKWLRTAVCTDDGVPAMPDDRLLDVLHLPSFELAKLVVEVRIRIGRARSLLGSRAA